MMKRCDRNGVGACLLALVAGVLCGAADSRASTIAQNVAWTIDRPGTTVKYRIVTYGDSLFAGYKGSISHVAIFAAPTVDADYASALWDADVENIRRSKSGATAKQVYDDKIVDDASYMETADTRVVAFEMCGNDARHARNDFKSSSGTCDYSGLDQSLATCTTYLELAMQFINDHAGPNTVAKVITNLYYAGYDDDDKPAECTDGETGQHPNQQDVYLPILLRMNWRMCHLASMHGFRCTDSFARFMGADYDSNGDHRKDSRALRYRSGESEDDYVERIGTRLRPTIRDAKTHFVSPTRSFAYLLSDDLHPTYHGGDIDLGILGGSASGSGPPRYPDAQYDDRRVPIWRRYGHERMGHALALENPPSP